MGRPINLADLSPWDQVRLCSVPTETYFSGAMAKTQLAKQDNTRIVLMFSSPSGGLVTISTQQGVISTQGFTITSQTGRVTLLSSQHGPLTNMPWFLSSTGPLNITVFEVFITRPVDPQQFGQDGQQQGLLILPGGNGYVPSVQPNNGSCPSGGCDYRWPKSETPSDNHIPPGCGDIIRYLREGRCS